MVHQRRFAMVDVGDDRKVSNIRVRFNHGWICTYPLAVVFSAYELLFIGLRVIVRTHDYKGLNRGRLGQIIGTAGRARAHV